MTDIYDQATEREEIDRELAIKAAASSDPHVESTGKCLECDCDVGEGVRWCSPECRDDWQRWNPGI